MTNNELDSANMVKVPFRTYTLEEDKEDLGEVISLRINKEERALLEELKSLMNFTADAKAIKSSLVLAKNVIHGTFTAPFFRYLTSSTRRKPVNEVQQAQVDFKKM